MAIVSELPPLMVLEEEAPGRLVFRFRNRRWAYATLAGAIALIGGVLWYQIAHQDRSWQFVIFYFFGFLLLHSTYYSFTADQYLIVSGQSRSIRFHKTNLYGSTDWERQAAEFGNIRVFRPRAPRGTGRARNWAIMLQCRDGLNLYLGENEFGSMNREDAFRIANLVSNLTGIPIDADAD